MTKKLQHLFALSEKGAKDLVKAVIWCFVCNLSLMFPVGAVLFTAQHLLNSMEYGGSSMDGFGIYTGFAITVLLLLFILHWFQYASLYLATYKESANRRISLAETLRRLPLCATVIRIHFLHPCNRHRHVLLRLADGTGRAVGSTSSNSSHSRKQKDPGFLWYKEYFKQTRGSRLHPGRTGNHTRY